MTALNQRYHISPNIIFQEVQLGESILLDVSSVTYFAFDPLGTRFWRAMQECDDADSVLNQIAAEDGVPVAELEPKFRGILAGLERGGLIQVTDTRQ